MTEGSAYCFTKVISMQHNLHKIWAVNCRTCQEENSKEQMATKMRDVGLQEFHAERYIASVQYVFLIVF